MQNKLLNACLVVSLIGILVLIFLSESMQPPFAAISSLNKNMLESSVAVRGNVVSERNFNNFQVIELCDNSFACIPITLNFQNRTNFTGRNISVFGRLAEYNSELQIEADKIIEMPAE